MTDEGWGSERRSAIMRAVRREHTAPELTARRVLHGLGYRYRLHCRDLPGSPDIVFPSRRKVIFVHGCFWHRHPSCRKASTPSTRRDFWETKFDQNVERDIRKEIQLLVAGWEVLVIWECETKNLDQLSKTLTAFLGPSNKAAVEL